MIRGVKFFLGKILAGVQRGDSEARSVNALPRVPLPRRLWVKARLPGTGGVKDGGLTKWESSADMADSKVSLTISINSFLPLPPLQIEPEFMRQGTRKLCAKNEQAGEYRAWRVRAATGGLRRE